MGNFRIRITRAGQVAAIVFTCFIAAVIKTIRATDFFIILESITFFIAAFLISLIYGRTRAHKSSLLMSFLHDCPSIWFLTLITTTIAAINFITGAKSSLVGFIRMSATWILSVYIGYSTMLIGGHAVIEKVMKSVVFFIFINAIYSLFEMAFHYNILVPIMTMERGVNMYGASNYRVAAMFVNPIPYATILLIGIWLTIYLYGASIKGYLILGIMALSFIFTRTRSGWASFGLTILLFATIYIYRKHKITLRGVMRVCVFICLGLLGYMLIPGIRSIVPFIVNRLLAAAGSVSEIQRLGAVEYILNYMRTSSSVFRNLFGHGFDASSFLMLETTIIIKNFSTVDNQYIAVLYDYGIIAFFVMIAYIWRLFKLLFTTKDKMIFYIDIAIIGFWLISLFYESTKFSDVYFIVFFFMGVLASYRSTQRKYRL